MNTLPQELARLKLEPTPEPCAQAKRLMLATGSIIDGFLDQDPTSLSPLLEHNYFLPEANLLIVGTGCRRPLVTREAILVSSAVESDLLIVRANDRPGRATFDVKLLASELVLFAYQLWIPQPTGTAWLVPSVGEGPCVRLEQEGLIVEQHPPYLDWADRHRGILFGAEYLSIAAQGWF
ncbi:hypothetical protein [Sphingomicrobium astaxanthinifaciens]|uniref:hypothetical protein n=1 Tax=Sphingomicrobium astaxanthinifaciens TaxID=1227949 RepID=UPI001FCB0DD5|nr:hypothetical protein [Sphingomicrobium astaxanthinifaciens]MCJ7420436.1 hypothetical protein [Sphingomicrobium astaxanthinifaciens]